MSEHIQVQLRAWLDQEWAEAADWLYKQWHGGAADLMHAVLDRNRMAEPFEQAEHLRELFAGLTDNELVNVGNLVGLALAETLLRMRENRFFDGDALENQWRAKDQEPKS